MDNDSCVIVRDMFKKETDLHLFIGESIISENGIVGSIEGPFGRTGKVRVTLDPSSVQVHVGQSVAMLRRKYAFT